MNFKRNWIADHFYDVEFQVFEMTQLNQFMNHLIAHNTIFVAVEYELVEYVFDALNKEYPGRVMLKPSLEMYYRYLQDNEIVDGAYQDFIIDEGTMIRYAKRKGVVKKVIEALGEYERTIAM